MKVFVTGTTGFIGSAIVRELFAAGHQVLGLARSDAAAASLASAGAEVHRGTLDDLDSLRSGAAAADGVIHLAYIHDFSDYQGAVQTDLRAVETIGAALEGSGKPFVITSGTLMLTFLLPPGRLGTEKDVADAGSVAPRIASENAVIALAERGVRSSVVRLPLSVHGKEKRGFVGTLIDIAREKGVSGYIGDGSNRWPAVHRLDAAHGGWSNLLTVDLAQAFMEARGKIPGGTARTPRPGGCDLTGLVQKLLEEMIATKGGFHD